jgi:hypothetical protein
VAPRGIVAVRLVYAVGAAPAWGRCEAGAPRAAPRCLACGPRVVSGGLTVWRVLPVRCLESAIQMRCQGKGHGHGLGTWRTRDWRCVPAGVWSVESRGTGRGHPPRPLVFVFCFVFPEPRCGRGPGKCLYLGGESRAPPSCAARCPALWVGMRGRRRLWQPPPPFFRA